MSKLYKKEALWVKVKQVFFLHNVFIKHTQQKLKGALDAFFINTSNAYKKVSTW